MASLVLNGNTSGSVTISSPAVSGTTTITLPTVSGGNFVVSDSSGNVGIGTSSPAQKLNVVQNQNATTAIQVDNSNASTSARVGTIFNSDTTQIAAYATSSGYTGVSGWAGAGVMTVGSGSTNGMILNCEGQPIKFQINRSEAMRIDSSGNVCVGTTSASIYGTNTIAMIGSDGAAFKVTGGTGNDAVYAWNNATTGNNGFVRFLTEGTATFRGEITYNRGSAVVAYGTSSDVRLKENIVDSSSSLNKINSIKIRSFDWKETGIHTDYGVIAQELFEVAPEAVIEGDNSDVVEKTWQVDTSVLVPAMIKAIQEQQTIIETLKTDIAELKAKVNV